MKTTCIHCGVTMQYESKGQLNVPSIGQTFVYRSKEELEGVAKSLADHSNEILVHLNGNHQMTASELHYRLKYEEIVTLIQSETFISHLQPIINIASGEIYGYESLLRSNSRALNPGLLFKAASLTGFHSMLDQKARRAAIEAKSKYVPRGVKSFINFLPSTIYNPEFCLRHTFQIVEDFGVDPNDLVFEVVETEKIEDIDHLKKVLNVYKREGMRVALDDVGSGFADPELLTLLNPDYVKIDRSYIDHCDENPDKQAFLRKIIHLARDRGITVLGEGIERKEELDYCRSIGIYLAQGYFIGKPMERPLIPSFTFD